jgi:predicted signal transduction protein with EAL and GGDEF domain
VSDEREPLQLRSAVVWAVIVAGAAIVVWELPEAVRFASQHARAGFWSLVVGALVVDLPLFGLFSRQDTRPRATLSVCFTFAIFVLWGAAPAVVVQAAAGAVTVIGQRYRSPAGLFLIARLVCATAVAQLVDDEVFGHRVTAPGEGLSGQDILSFVLLGVVWLAVSYGLLALSWAVVTVRGLRQAISDIWPNLAITASAVLVVSPLLTTIQGAWKLIVVAPVMVFNQIFREQVRIEQRLTREPLSGALSVHGLAGGMRDITDYDAVWRRGRRPFGIVLVDVEAVLAIDRMLGRDTYEGVVAAAARRLVDVYGEDRVAGLSGYTFAILVPDLVEDDARSYGDAVAEVLAPPLEVNDVPFSLDPAAGVALSPQHGSDLSSLLVKAALAMTEARRRALPAMVYLPQEADLTRRRLELVRELRTALRDPTRWDELAMLYQPQVDLDTQRLVGVEALVRWQHPEWGLVPTDELIEAVEPTEVMHLLTMHVLLSVVTQMREWNDEGLPLRVAVNISVQDLHVPSFAGDLATLIDRYGIAAPQLTVEITERMLVTDQPQVGHTASELTRLGVGLSLDDFGTGHASLQQLRRLPLSEVKVDRAFVSGIVDSPADQAVVSSVHQMARALGVAVVAEGVEDERTARALARLPGIIGQGWHFGRPMPAYELRQRSGHGSTWSG